MRITTGLLALSLCAQCVYANVSETNFVSRMANTMDYVESNQDTVWPGFHLNSTPIVIDFQDFEEQAEHIYALNFNPVNLPWEKLKLDNHDIYYLGENLIDPELFFFSGRMQDVDTKISFIDSETTQFIETQENFYNKLTLSRSLYYLREESKIEKDHLADLSRDYDGFNDLTNLKLMFLEHSALSASLQTKGQESEAALQDAAAVHQYRRQLLNKDRDAFENANEIYRGTATYISWQSMNLAYDDFVRKSHLTACHPLSLLIGVDGLIQCAIQGYPSFSSTSYGHALDTRLSSSHWKTTVETKFESISTIMRDYYQMSDATATTLAAGAMANPKYNYSRTSSVIDDMLKPHLEKMNAAISEYQNAAGVEFYAPFIWNYIENFFDRAFGNNPEMYLININKDIRKDFDGELSSGNDESEDIIYKHLPYGLTKLSFNSRNELDYDNSYSLFKLAGASTIVIDGLQTTVAAFAKAGKSQSFSTLRVDDEHMFIALKEKGVLDASDGAIKLRIPFMMDKAVFNGVSLSQLEAKPTKLKPEGFGFKYISKK